MMRPYFWGFGHPFMAIIGLLFFALIVYFVFSGTIGSCHMGQHGGHQASTNKPLEELKSRYVKWEISKKEFEEIKKDIE